MLSSFLLVVELEIQMWEYHRNRHGHSYILLVQNGQRQCLTRQCLMLIRPMVPQNGESQHTCQSCGFPNDMKGKDQEISDKEPATTKLTCHQDLEKNGGAQTSYDLQGSKVVKSHPPSLPPPPPPTFYKIDGD